MTGDREVILNEFLLWVLGGGCFVCLWGVKNGLRRCGAGGVYWTQCDKVYVEGGSIDEVNEVFVLKYTIGGDTMVVWCF